uniref:Uncharacterized protein n=1 Tax=Wuchereria bancrofti TaxID=6293 RepID=A0AAF5PZ55_WUCBA
MTFVILQFCFTILDGHISGSIPASVPDGTSSHDGNKRTVESKFPTSIRDESFLHDDNTTLAEISPSFVSEEKPSSNIDSRAKVPKKRPPTKQRGNRSKFRFRPRGKFGLVANLLGNVASGIINQLRK